jgi:hypothetical protein
MGDVAAVVLSLGEEYTERAIASLHRQSIPVAEMIVVRGISPFHRAFNHALSRIRTEFFIQVDADMILDDTCLEKLRELISDGVGSVVGHLRDPLLGHIVGIKLFRTRCFDRVNLRDSLSAETDFVVDSLKEGWRTIYARKHRWSRDTFGEHRPDYNAHYTFCKFLRDGAKARYRKSGGELLRLFRRLQISEHPAVAIATIAAAHGIFIREKRDLHGPLTRSEDFEFLERFLMTRESADHSPLEAEDLLRGSLRKQFKRSYQLGSQLRRHHALFTFKNRLLQLRQRRGIASWVALVGLCHGLFVDAYNDAEADEAFYLLRDLLPTYYLCFRY